jgi:hypothetical protein
MTMPSSASPFPLTLPGIQAMGVDAWLHEYRPALPGREYQAGYERIFGAYCRALPTAAEHLALHTCGLVEYKVPFLLAGWWFEYRKRRELVRRNIDLLFDDAVSSPAAAAERVRHRHILGMGNDPAGLRRYWHERLAMARRNWRTCSLGVAFHPGRHGAGGYLLGEPTRPELVAYLKDHPLPTAFLQPIGCLGIPPEPTSADRATATAFATRFLAELALEQAPDGEIFDDEFKSAFARLFAVDLAWLRQGMARLRSWRDGELLLASVAHRPSRFVAAAWRALGRKVTGFSHGNNYLWTLPAGMVNSGAHRVCDRFVVCSHGEETLVQYARLHRPTPFCSEATVESVPTSVFRSAFTALQARPPVREIRTVMVIGFPMDYHHTPGLVDHNTLSFAHLTLKLMQALREAGYRVLYKAHPDTITETAGFFDGYADEVLTENFTAVMDRADCLLYVSPFTTTLGYGLLSRIPAVIIHHPEWDCWHPDVYRALTKRVAVLSIASDPSGVLQFQPDDLAAAVRSSQNLTDTELVERWAL